MRLIDAIGLKQALAVSAILEDKKTIEQIIDEQPTVQPEQRWIPVSERLPEVGQAVIVTTKNGYRAIRKCVDAGLLKWFYNDIIAWMPSPEPYQGESEDKE